MILVASLAAKPNCVGFVRRNSHPGLYAREAGSQPRARQKPLAPCHVKNQKHQNVNEKLHDMSHDVASSSRSFELRETMVGWVLYTF